MRLNPANDFSFPQIMPEQRAIIATGYNPFLPGNLMNTRSIALVFTQEHTFAGREIDFENRAIKTSRQITSPSSSKSSELSRSVAASSDKRPLRTTCSRRGSIANRLATRAYPAR